MNEENIAPVNEQEHTVLRHQPRRNYSAKFQTLDGEIDCYTKKQMKSLYPKADFVGTAEYAPGSKKEKTGELRYSGKSIPVAEYGSHSRLVYKEKGFAAVDKMQDGFVVLLKKALPLRIAALTLCIAVIALGVFFAFSPRAGDIAIIEDEDIIQAGPLELEEGAEEWEGVRPEDTASVKKGIAIPGYKRITIEADSTEVKVNLHNPENNPCYFVISLVLDDGTVLYKSKMLEPGMGIYNITLSEPLVAGEYGAMVMYETYSLSTLKPMNGANVILTLVAK